MHKDQWPCDADDGCARADAMRRASAWLSRLDCFATRLMSDLSRLRSPSPSAPEAAQAPLVATVEDKKEDAPATALLAAQMLTDAAARLDGVCELCAAASCATGGALERSSSESTRVGVDAMHERLILSDVRGVATGGELYNEHVAAIARAPRRLVPAARMPYMRYFRNRTCV
jgi:hypothetical protein